MKTPEQRAGEALDEALANLGRPDAEFGAVPPRAPPPAPPPRQPAPPPQPESALDEFLFWVGVLVVMTGVTLYLANT